MNACMFQRSSRHKQNRASLANFAQRFNLNLLYGNQVAIGPYRANSWAVWTQLKRSMWARMRFDLTDTTVAISRRAMFIVPTLAMHQGRHMTQTGAWNAYAHTSTTGSNQRSVGNTSIGVSTAGRKLTQVITPYDSQPYDVYVAYTQRTAGGFCKPYIDGSQDLIEIGDPQSLGFKAFNCYGPVDNTRRNLVKLASNLTGIHTIELEVVAGVPTGSSASGTGTVTIESLLYSSELNDPMARPTHWAQGQAIVVGDEREYGGQYYCCTVAGTTGATPPTHTSGTASDGGVTWTAAGATYYSGWVSTLDLDYASEVESAIVSLVHNSTTYDVGGQTHLNEYVANQSVKLDGVQKAPLDPAMLLTFGSKVEIDEDLTWKVPNAAGTLIGEGTRKTIITPNQVENSKRIVAKEDFTIANAYGAMFPFVYWDGFWRRLVFDSFLKPDGTTLNPLNYAANTTVSLGKTFKSFAAKTVNFFGTLLYEVTCAPESVNHYAAADSEAQVIMNVGNTTTPPVAGTSADWQAKLYFMRKGATPEAIAVGQLLEFNSIHRMAMTA